MSGGWIAIVISDVLPLLKERMMCMMKLLYLHKRFGIWVLGLMWMVNTVYASDINRFISYSNHEGLNQNTINAIEQDRLGNLWVGTPNGLIRFDGYDFHEYSWNPKTPFGLVNNKIDDIHSDKAGLLWIVNSIGIQIFDPANGKFHDVRLDPGTRVQGLVEKNDSTLWVLGQNYLATISARMVDDSLHQRITSNLITEDLTPLWVNDLLQISEEKMLLATDLGLYLIKLIENKSNKPLLTYIEPTALPPQYVNRLCIKDETIWIGSMEGLHSAILDSDKLIVLETYLHDPGNPGSIQANSVKDLLISRENQLWIGTLYGGLSIYNESGNDFFNYTHDPHHEGTISSSMVNCLYEDDFDIIWVGTAQGGLCKLDPHQKSFIHHKNNPFNKVSIPGNLISSIIEDSKGHLWISTYMQALSRSKQAVNDRSISELEFDRFDEWHNSFREKNIISLYEDQQGYIWIGYETAVVIYDPDQDEFREVSFIANKQEIPIFGAHEITSVREGLKVIGSNPILLIEDPIEISNSKTGTRIDVLSSYRIPGNTQASSTLIDRKGQLWVGSKDNGLYLFDLQQKKLDLLRIFKSDENNATINLDNGIFCLHEDLAGNIWVGSFGGGLYRITGENTETYELQYIDTKGQLSDDAIYGILQENRNILWFSTDMGLCRYDMSTSETIIYNVNDGLLNNNFRWKAYHAGSSGYFYFGGLNGLSCFRPGNIQSNHIPPKVEIVGMKVNDDPIMAGVQINRRFTLDQSIDETDRIVLDPRNRSVSFEILIRHNASPHNNRMSFILHGFDQEWNQVASGKYTATYMNLPPGDYKLEINGYNGDGLISKHTRNLQITVLKPWFGRWWSILIIGILILGATSSILLYLMKLERLKQRLLFEQKDKERIVDINQAKLKFFTNISHEFRTLLTIISAPLQILMENEESGKNRKYLGVMDKNTKRLGFLIDQLLSFRKIEKEKMDLKLVRTSLGDLIYPVGEAFEAYALKSGLLFDYTVTDSHTSVVLDYKKMEMVVFNLLSNAFKFTPANGKVKLACKPMNRAGAELVQIQVTDSGIGIAEDKLELIFDRFYQAESEFSYTGTGIGLSYSKAIVELHQGSIQVSSKKGVETSFTIEFPLINGEDMEITNVEVLGSRTKDLLTHEELSSSLYGEGAMINDNSKPSILVIDDKAEFCNLLTDILDSKFKVLSAANGKEGLENVIKNEPDLVITDVMMPVINGFDLCQKIKTDIELCHIPVIVMSALGKEKEITGAEYGADEYINKPFDVNYLVAKVDQLIENKKRIQDHFSQFQSLPETLNLSSTDKEFMLKVNKVINQNLDNHSFGVEELAQEMSFSTSLIYRKLKQFTGQIPSRYLLNYRLQIAAIKIRKDPYISMKAVGYEVGFASASHFTRAFKNKFGLTPGEYAKNLI